MSELRPELPPLPERMRRLPVHRGYPVPWFVAWLDDEHCPLPRGRGTPDFRVLHPDATTEAWYGRRCWVCGGTLGSYRAFVLGPMCAVNRNSAEPPSHRDCADFSARACPFLARPHARRRDAGMPDDAVEAPGIMLRRNPGVALVWITRRPAERRDPNGGLLFDIGDPVEVRWYAEGREATRDEVLTSIRTGLPALRDLAAEEGPSAERFLDSEVKRAMELVPT